MLEWNGYEIAETVPYPPKIITLCGSTKFGALFEEVNLRLTLQGILVFSIGCNMQDDTLFSGMPDELKIQVKTMLDAEHKRKIELSHGIYVINPGDYIGESTGSEIRWARTLHKPIDYLVKHQCHETCLCHYENKKEIAHA